MSDSGDEISGSRSDAIQEGEEEIQEISVEDDTNLGGSEVSSEVFDLDDYSFEDSNSNTDENFHDWPVAIYADALANYENAGNHF
jgi:hypothetical protein